MTLLDQIEAFCTRKGISGYRFGGLSTGCPKTVKRMREGYHPGPDKSARMLQFMADNDHADLRPVKRGDIANLPPIPPQEMQYHKNMIVGSERLLARLWTQHPRILRRLQRNGLTVKNPTIGVQANV